MQVHPPQTLAIMREKTFFGTDGNTNTNESTLHIDKSISRAVDLDVASDYDTASCQGTPNNHTFASTKTLGQHIQKNHTYVSSYLYTEIYSIYLSNFKLQFHGIKHISARIPHAISR